MPNRRFGRHAHIKDVEGEFQVARLAVDRLKAQASATPEFSIEIPGLARTSKMRTIGVHYRNHEIS